MNRFQEVVAIQKHRKALQKLAKEKGYSFPFHDFVKMINVIIFGDRIATKIHRVFSKHHAHVVGEVYKFIDDKKVHLGDVRDITNKVEAVFDWESARFTKPEKPLNAFQTWKKYYPDIDMKETLKSLGFWEGE